jgi:hypothetical protein
MALVVAFPTIWSANDCLAEFSRVWTIALNAKFWMKTARTVKEGIDCTKLLEFQNKLVSVSSPQSIFHHELSQMVTLQMRVETASKVYQ